MKRGTAASTIAAIMFPSPVGRVRTALPIALLIRALAMAASLWNFECSLGERIVMTIFDDWIDGDFSVERSVSQGGSR